MKRTHTILPEAVLGLMLLVITLFVPISASADGSAGSSAAFNCYLIVNKVTIQS